MQKRSTLAEVGTILILVGAIVSVFGAVIMIGMAIFFAAIASSADLPSWFGFFYGALGLLMSIGAVVGFMGFKAARAGEIRRGGILGIASACLPPLQAITLAGGICCLVSEEAKAESTS